MDGWVCGKRPLSSVGFPLFSFFVSFFRFSAFPFVGLAKSTTADADNLPRELVYGLGVGACESVCGCGLDKVWGWVSRGQAKPSQRHDLLSPQLFQFAEECVCLGLGQKFIS